MGADTLGRCFVVMPFGRKPGPNGTTIDFDLVYERLLKPAIAAAGLRPHRADAELRAGSIHGDMFFELLLAEFVVADLTVDNPNVWYEVGVRHALRSAGVVLTYSSARERLPFDIAGQRCLRYGMAEGAPDPASLDADTGALAAMIGETLGAWRERKASPVYQELPFLEEPRWKARREGDINEFWQQLDAWKGRLDVARRKGRAGDILTLAEETPNRLLALEATKSAAEALRQLNRPVYGLRAARRALEIDPKDERARQFEGIFLGRDKRFEEAAVALERLAEEQAAAKRPSGETLGLIGRTRKDEWSEQMRRLREEEGLSWPEAAREAKGALELAARAYAAGFRASPGDHFPGINALTLGRLWEHLAGEAAEGLELDAIAAGVRWLATNAANANPNDIWARASLGERHLVLGERAAALKCYDAAGALALDAKDAFALDSMAQQLRLLRELGLHAEIAEAALDGVEKRLRRLGPRQEPAHVVLFSGHMVDKPGRASPRFPEERTDAAGARIAAELERIGAGAGDLGICQAACGGDLLFAEACLARGMRLWVMLPQEETAFRRDSVFGGRRWQEAYDRLRASPLAEWRAASEELGPPPEGSNIYERCNRWMMHTALSQGVRRVEFVALWDGESGGDGPGGTAHVAALVAELTGRQPAVIDPKAL